MESFCSAKLVQYINIKNHINRPKYRNLMVCMIDEEKTLITPLLNPKVISIKRNILQRLVFTISRNME